ncbi:MAG: class I SAM-dependent methyltransferase [Bacillota bacterium]
MTKSVASLYGAALDRMVHFWFPVWQKMGLHITRNHFYQAIPDTSALPKDFWDRRSEMVGVDLRDQVQLRLLQTFAAKYRGEYERFPMDRPEQPHQYFVKNGMFAGVDGEILYCMVRHFKPKRIFEIGSGNSTYLSAQAVLKNREEGCDCQLVAYEPYPNETLRKGFPGLAKLVETEVQKVEASAFKELEENDILFIDSSHVLKIGSDVQYEFLEILPRLNRGVLVHVHDVFLPYAPPKDWVVKQQRFWNEQYILQAFLTYNQAFRVMWAGHYMHRTYPQQLRAAFKSYSSTTSPASFWMRCLGSERKQKVQGGKRTLAAGDTSVSQAM